MDIVVSNRVARITPGGPMVGGLAAALLPAVKKSGVVWFGSSGNMRRIERDDAPLVEVEGYGRGTIARVDLPEQHYRGFYEGYANSCLWPLLHSRADIAHARADDYASYCAVNAYMARTLANFAAPQFHLLDPRLPFPAAGAANCAGSASARRSASSCTRPGPERRTIAHWRSTANWPKRCWPTT